MEKVNISIDLKFKSLADDLLANKAEKSREIYLWEKKM